MKSVWGFVAKMCDDFGVFKFSLAVLSVFFLFFDVWQLFTSANEILAVVSVMCLMITVAGHMGLLGTESQAYYLVYLVPCFLLGLGLINGIESLGLRSGDFELSALATVMSALVPVLGATCIASIICVKRVIFG
ncbi:MAG: hypothetical protein WCC29_12265 [Pseudomonas farsensis]|uniref:hypothetical protein n=1 Tax=Pseudomonas farsensis TaxID=2745492 RepID=UPI003C7E8FC1